MKIPDTLVEYLEPISAGNQIKEHELVTKSETLGPNSQIEDILNCVIPPRYFKDEKDHTWMQFASPKASSRQDVITLTRKLEQVLEERQAREQGICPVREDIYAQCFDELIRQECLNCPERGLLLMRVRDELRMRIDAYKVLYDSSVVFGVRKHLEADQKKVSMDESKLAQKHKLEMKVAELRNKIEVTEKRHAEKRALNEKRRKQEIEFLKNQGQHLDSFLKSLSGSRD